MSEINTVRQLVDYAAEKYGEKDFCRFIRDGKVERKSYGEFREDCLAVCRYIRSVKKERIHIAFIGSTNYEYIACLTGMIFSGNVVVPFAPDISVDEAADLFEDADIELLFCEDAFSEKAREVQKKYPGLKEIVSLGNAQWFDGIFEKYKTGSFFNGLSNVAEYPDHCSLIIYTSGTTGRRKGVMLSNRNLAANSCYNEYNLEATDVSFSVLPMHHVFCYACDVLKTLYDGGTLCLNGELRNLYSNLLAFEPTIMRIVPALCKSILTRIKVTEKQNPSLTPREAAEKVVGKNFRRMISGSAFLSAALIDGFEKYGITVRQGYGMSECSPRISTSDFIDTENKYSNGKVLSVNEVRIVDNEIQVKGPSVMLGYYKRPQETKEAFTPDGFLHTGDLGYLKGNHIYLTGRKKNLIILSNGENVSPEEIENRFVDDGIVKEIVVVGEDDKFIAEIYPDLQFAEAHGISDIELSIQKIVDRVNIDSPQDRQIFAFRLREKPFLRTSTGKIKRTEFHYKGVG